MICLLTNCAGKPVTLVQIDLKNNRGNPQKIIEVDDKKCELKSERLPPIPLQYSTGAINPYLDQGVWVSKDDFFRLYELWLRDCKNKNFKEAQKHE